MELKDLMPAVITILLIGIVMGVGIYILAEVGDNLADTEGTVTNESGAYLNSTGYTLGQASASGFNNPSITAAYNASDGTLLGSGNYSVSDAGVLTNASATTYADVNVSYTYEYGGDAYDAVDTTVDGVGDFAGWIAVIVVVIAAAIVLGIVLRSFGQGAKM